ncbi:MAG: hypothetical protein IJY15_13545, partial [Thermoguttaceae bacterium]|nr:hypothetical protein [Thermoguttaceae bacterium]
MSTVARRSVVVERLRRLLFSPSKLSAVGALALTFATAAPALAQTYTMPNIDISVAEYGGMLDLTEFFSYNDPSQTYDSTISLDGGVIWLSTSLVAPTYDAETETLHMWTLLHEKDVVPSNAEEEALSAKHQVDSYKQLGLDLEAAYGGPISKTVEHKGHFLDLSAGGTVFLLNSQQNFEDMRGLYADMNGLAVSPQEINGDFGLAGDGSLTFAACDAVYQSENDRVTAGVNYFGKTTFNGATNVLGGALNIFGDSEFNDLVTVVGYTAPASLYLGSGEHVFHEGVTVSDASLHLLGADDRQITLEKDLIVWGSELNSYGSVHYDGNVLIASEAGAPTRAIFASDFGGLGEGRATFNENSVLNLTGTSISENGVIVDHTTQVFANANCLNVDVFIHDASLFYCNVDKKTIDQGLTNKFYLTYDENQTPTFLEWEAGRSNLENAIANGNVIERDIIGYRGFLTFTSVGSQYVAPGETANGYTVVVDAKNQDQYDYKL